MHMWAFFLRCMPGLLLITAEFHWPQHMAHLFSLCLTYYKGLHSKCPLSEVLHTSEFLLGFFEHLHEIYRAHSPTIWNALKPEAFWYPVRDFRSFRVWNFCILDLQVKAAPLWVTLWDSILKWYLKNWPPTAKRASLMWSFCQPAPILTHAARFLPLFATLDPLPDFMSVTCVVLNSTALLTWILTFYVSYFYAFVTSCEIIVFWT